MDTTNLVTNLRDKIRAYDKENLEEMLHAVAEGIRVLSGRDHVRIYLEDLTDGVLACAFASGRCAREWRAVSFPSFPTIRWSRPSSSPRRRWSSATQPSIGFSWTGR